MVSSIWQLAGVYETASGSAKNKLSAEPKAPFRLGKRRSLVARWPFAFQEGTSALRQQQTPTKRAGGFTFFTLYREAVDDRKLFFPCAASTHGCPRMLSYLPLW